jgi:hypothetical protein
VQLAVRDVGVAADGREAGVAEVGNHEAGIPGLLALPSAGGVAERVCGHAFLKPGARCGASDDQSQDRGLKAVAFELPEDGLVLSRSTRRAKL